MKSTGDTKEQRKKRMTRRFLTGTKNGQTDGANLRQAALKPERTFFLCNSIK